MTKHTEKEWIKFFKSIFPEELFEQWITYLLNKLRVEDLIETSSIEKARELFKEIKQIYFDGKYESTDDGVPIDEFEKICELYESAIAEVINA